MNVRTMVLKAAMVGVLAGVGLAISAGPAAAEANDDSCSEEWAGVAEAQAGMGRADTQYEFWTWFRAWQTNLSTISRYC
jgi:hypothetical protein